MPRRPTASILFSSIIAILTTCTSLPFSWAQVATPPSPEHPRVIMVADLVHQVPSEQGVPVPATGIAVPDPDAPALAPAVPDPEPVRRSAPQAPGWGTPGLNVSGPAAPAATVPVTSASVPVVHRSAPLTTATETAPGVTINETVPVTTGTATAPVVHVTAPVTPVPVPARQMPTPASAGMGVSSTSDTTPMAGAASEEDAPRYGGTVPFPQTINDPIEGYNRAIFAFNDQLINLFINPLEKGYRAIAPEPVRKSIRKAGINLAYPVRLINTLLQGKGKGALSETGRFLINSTVGLLGFFDPATRIGLPAYNEDFGQTFGHYGYKFGFYFVLPFFGSSSGRDALGWIFDTAFNPATYAGGSFFSFNDWSFKLPTYMQLRTVERDPYVFVRDFMAIQRRKDVEDYAIKADHVDPDPTLKSILLKLQDKNFPKRMVEHKAVIPATGKKLPYSAWIQDNPAPLVYVLGGVGSHRMSESTMALAEILYNDRFSVVTISSAMNWEFMENAATAAVPGYPVTDAQDVYNALDSINRDLKRRYPGHFNRPAALMGISMGGIHTMFISTFAENMPSQSLHFARYVAIDTPTDLIYALKNLDNYYNAALNWRPEERRRKIEETLMKAMALSEAENVDPQAELPFSKTESRYLIGLAFKLILRDVIYSSQKRALHEGTDSPNVLQNSLSSISREPVYEEIVKYSFIDYMNRFVIPYYKSNPNLRIPREELLANSNLRSIETSLKANTKIRAFINDSDFFLRPEDLAWYKATFGNRLTVLSKGGHMGNLYRPDVQQRIVEAIVDIKDLPSR